MPSAQLHHSRTQASCARLTTHSPGSSRRCAAATPFFETRTMCRTLLAVPESACHSPCGRRTHLPPVQLCYTTLCCGCLPLHTACTARFSLQSLPTRLLSSVGVRCCLSISVSVPVSLSLSLFLSCVVCLVPCALCRVSCVLCLVSCALCLVSCVCVFVVCMRLSVSVTDCLLCLVSGSHATNKHSLTHTHTPTVCDK